MGDVSDLVVALRDFLMNENMPDGDEQIDRRFAVAKAHALVEPHAAEIDRAWAEHAALLAVERAARTKSPARLELIEEALAALDAVRAKEASA